MSRTSSTLKAGAAAMRNLLLGANLKTLTLPPRRAVGYVGECLFIYRSMASRNELPQRTPWEVLADAPEVGVKLLPDAAGEWFREVGSYAVDLVALCAIAQLLQPRLIFEIGTFHGSGAAHLAANAPLAKVYTLDLGPADAPSLSTTLVDGFHIAERKYNDISPRVQRLFGDSASFDFSPFHSQVELFFIDGAHSYAYVKSDTENALACTRPGGVVAWHDYGRCGVNGVSRWLHEMARAGRQIYRVPGGSLAFMQVT